MRADLSEEWFELTNRLALAAELLSGTVHDVNNFLQGISGNAELIESAATDDERTARRARAIVTNAGHASASLAGLQSLLREVDGAAGRVDLHAMASQALALRGYALRKARIQMFVERPDAAAIAVARTRSVLQIVLNLILNAEQALAASKDGRIRILAAARDGQAELTVEDNGGGLPEDVRSRLFEAHIGRSANRLGLGLMVSDRLARAQGGTLSHSAPPAGGCAMTLSLPAAAQDAPSIR